MRNLLTRLSTHVSESMQLKLMLKDLSLFFQIQFGLVEISSIAQLLKLGKQLDIREAPVKAYPSVRGKSIQHYLTYIDHPVTSVAPTNQEIVLNSSPSTSRAKCWNCSQTVHRFHNCPRPRQRFCYNCGKQKIPVRTCIKCSGNTNSTHRVIP